ncbi:MAG: UxaA family hydrolase [Candidatus Parvarchaeota archaeon]|uniref:UxaA family hydrolase n=1 Tax=Metallosphaera sp. TaxID=2020860 RepID=UPI0031765497
MKNIALKIDQNDNVATALSDIEAGATVTVRGDQDIEIVVSSHIPRGHKFALSDISQGSSVIKYGEVIGIATRDIKKGDYVHIHNLDSIRGKAGDNYG